MQQNSYHNDLSLLDVDMKLQCEAFGKIQIVHLTGRIDSTTAETFGHEMGAIIANGNRQLLLDFTLVPYINSAGLRVILVVAKRLKNPGDRCVFCGMADEVLKIFELAGFTRILEIYPTVEDATTHW